MADPIFADPRLAAIYDVHDGDRADLDAYSTLIASVGASSILDVGCGTGTFAIALAGRGHDVTAVDPAAASLAIARSKPGAHRVRWCLGTADDVTVSNVDVVTMTGNVAQVFVDDAEWRRTLVALRSRLRPGGRFVFETRDPTDRAWTRWTRDASWRRVQVEGAGLVESWVDLLDVSLPLVTFRWTYRFLDRDGDDATVVSASTLRFRTGEEIERDLDASGFEVSEVRDAPDRPGRELVFVARTRPVSPVSPVRTDTTGSV